MQNQLGGRSHGATGSDRPVLPGSHLPQTMHLFFLFSFIIYVYDLSLQKKICTRLVVYRKKLYIQLIQLVVREKYTHKLFMQIFVHTSCTFNFYTPSNLCS
jgi:hypothetical protein